MAARGNKKFRKDKPTFSQIYREVEVSLPLDSVSNEDKKGKLYLVSTPIGDYSDITIRALKVLDESDYIICEDTKITSRLLRFFGIKKEMKILDEHNEAETAINYAGEIAAGKTAALVSDCGTPVFADPGLRLVRECINFGIPMEFVHGANSVISTIVVSGFDISRFYFYGFLSPKREIRVKEISGISGLDYPVILMDTPYRLITLLDDISDKIPEREIFLATNLSTDSEKFFRGRPEEIKSALKLHFGEEKPKAEFVLVIKQK
ncbi:MAG: SAM-dependent methyltransferase [Ignavibacteria bacterium]|nr:SAM-dependent methyltransferase [Ignavibacteria bacterium]